MTKAERIQYFRLISPLSICLTEDMIHTLDHMGFFDAPASSKYHGNYEGGLFDHSVNVFEHLMILTSAVPLEWERDISPFLIAFLHDLCKADQYKKVGDHYEFNTDAPHGFGKRVAEFPMRTYFGADRKGERHLPEEWRMWSHKDRKALLAGIIDADGHINNSRGCHVQVGSTNKALAIGEMELANSLGFDAKLYKTTL